MPGVELRNCMTLQAEYVPSSQLQSREIKGAGAKVTAGYSGEASYRLVTDFPSRFLVCVTYFEWRTLRKESGRADDAKAFDCCLKLNWILLNLLCRYSYLEQR